MVNEKGQERKYITEKQAAEFLGISEGTLRACGRTGILTTKLTSPRRRMFKESLFDMSTSR